MRELPKALQDVDSDGLDAPEVGPWAEQKYRLLYHYANMFAVSMKQKWDQRVYVDLFACAGKARVKGSNRTVLTSALLALSVDVPFDRYIFCEEDILLMRALKKRVERYHGRKSVRYVDGNCNERTEEILSRMPELRRGESSLAFCFVDPCKVEHLRFKTLEALANRYVDFLILIPTGMDINRNLDLYLKRHNDTLENYFGYALWREDLARARKAGDFVDVAITRIFSSQMRKLGYGYGGTEDSALVRLDSKNLPLYRLAFFSRHKLGEKFWRQARKSSSPQRSLFGDLG